MEFTTDVFLNKWHLIALILTIFALTGLIAGGYKRETIISTTAKLAACFYIIVTIPFVWNNYHEGYYEKKMVQALDKSYEESPNNFMLTVAYFEDEDTNDFLIKVYVGNYDETEPFSGTVQYVSYKKNDVIQRDETVEHLELKAGEKKEVASYKSKEKPTRYEYVYKE